MLITTSIRRWWIRGRSGRPPFRSGRAAARALFQSAPSPAGPNLHGITATLVNAAGHLVPPHGGRLALGPTGDLYLFGDAGGVLMLARFDDAGGVAETRAFGTSGAVAHDIDIDETGAVYLVGRTTGDLDFGLGPMSGSANDVFVAKVAP